MSLVSGDLVAPKPEIQLIDLEANPLLRVQVTAKFVLQDEMRIDMFMHRKQRELGNQRPVDLAATEIGARQVEKLLWAIHSDKRL